MEKPNENKADKKRKPGSLKGKIKIADDFDETSEEIIDMFYGNNEKLED